MREPQPVHTIVSNNESDDAERRQKDLELAATVAADMTAKGVPCTPEDVLIARGITNHVASLLRLDPTAINRATRRLADQSDPLGMTSAILLGKLVRELRSTESDAERIALVSVCMLHVLALATFSSLPKWNRKRG